MEHACIKENEISVLKEQVKTLKKAGDKEEAWKVRIENKVDKIVWFIMTQSVATILAVVGAVTIYAITR